MRKFNVAEDIVTAGELEVHVGELLEQLRETRRHVVITQDGRPAAVPITLDDFEDIAYEEQVREKIREGLESLAREPTISPEDAKKRAFAAIARVAEQSRGARRSIDPDTR